MKQIRRLFLLLIIVVYSSLNASANYHWTLKSSFPSTGRDFPSGFTIGTNAYVGQGYYVGNLTNDYWKWDQTTNSWSQIAPFPGTTQFGCVSFTVGTYGYVCTGGNLPSLYKETWEYDPSLNAWTQKANFPGSSRYIAVGFSIGQFGYLATGYTPGYVRDCYQYDPQNNTWALKNNFGGSARVSAVGFALNGKGYIGTGNITGGSNVNDFWEYEPSNDTWTQKSDFPGVPRYGASGFSIDSLNLGFVGSGGDGTNFFRDFYSFDPTNNLWTQIDSIPGVGRRHTASFSIGSSGYVTCGITTGPNYLNDLWEYAPLPPDAINENNISGIEMSLFPNPATSTISIGDKIKGKNVTKMRLYNDTGKLLYSIDIKNIADPIDVSTLTKGLYFIVFISKENEKFHSRFMKE
ncbi:MAG: T9SS type A sorting domain-containing protein [Bacteroidetes bacterium]|nr:T9SS type A sorting domain-containing protein [Bacteroidota bacterium]